MTNTQKEPALNQAAQLVEEAMELLKKSVHYQSNWGVILEHLQLVWEEIDAEIDYEDEADKYREQS